MQKITRASLSCRAIVGLQKRCLAHLQPSLKPQPNLNGLHDQDDPSKWINMDIINPNIKKMEYFIRDPLVLRANEIISELEQVRFFCSHKRTNNIFECNLQKC